MLVPPLRFPGFTDEWEPCLISDYGDIVTGNTPPTNQEENYSNGEYLWASPSDLGTEKYVHTTQTMLSKMGFRKTRVLPPNAILVTCIGSTIGKMGMAKYKMSTNQQINSIIVNPEFDADFVYYAVQSKFPRYISSIAVQAVPILSKSEFGKLSNSKTSIEEQKQIGHLLSIIDERIATQNKIIEDLKKLKSAISVNLLHCDCWELYRIKDIATLGRGRVISSQEISQQNNPKYPVYSSQTSNDGIMGYLDDYMYDGEYISWTTDGANAGTVFYRNGKFNCTNVCGLLKLGEGFDTHFVSLVLSDATKKYVSTNLANPKLMNNTMGDIQIRLPQLCEQRRLSVIFCKLQEMLTINRRILTNYILQKQYLLSQMFI